MWVIWLLAIIIGVFLWVAIIGGLANLLAAIGGPVTFLPILPAIPMAGFSIARDRFGKKAPVKRVMNLGIILSGTCIPLMVLIIFGISLLSLLTGILAMGIVLVQLMPDKVLEPF